MTVPSSSSPRPATAAPLAPASAITPQQHQEIISSVTTEVTHHLQTVTTPVPGVNEVPSSSPFGSAASVMESPIVRISEHVATPPTAVAQLAVSNAFGSAHAAISGETFLAPNSSHVQPTQEYHSISLPIDCRISIKLKNKIWNDEYNKFQLSFSSSDAGLPPSLFSKAKKITNISGWMNAFRIFVGVYAQKYPHDSPALIKYGDIVQDLADRGENWQLYDEACLPHDKLQKCVEFIGEFLRLKKVTLRKIQSLVGLLNFACSIVTAGRAFLHRLIDLAHGVRLSHHLIKLNGEAKEDLNVWLSFLPTFNG
jgi:hypothetical protein